MQNFVQKADALTVAAPSGGVTSGDFVVVGAICGFAATTALVGADVELQREGVFSGAAKATGTAWTKGDVLYWDSSAKKFTKTATGNARVAAAAADAASGDATGSVLLDRMQPSGLNNPVAGLTAGSKLARSATAAALDGSNPTPIATGLATIVAAGVQLRGTAAPGDNTSVLTTDYTGSDGTLNVYAWKNTGGTDPTLVASTGTETFDWWAIGT